MVEFSDCSTTRRVITEKPGLFDASVDGMTTLLKTPVSEQKIAEGGLRLQGHYKTSSEANPLITVVTVVYCGVEYLEDTIKSVIGQTYDNVEYIVVDGGSKDGTLDIIRKYEHAIDYWVSEPDNGIYDAMNKAIDLGSGEWKNFMNAGDKFSNSEVLSRVFAVSNNYEDVVVIYGDHEVMYPNKRKEVKAGKIENIWKGSQFCHQSSFIRLNYHKRNHFNLCRKIAADFEFFYRTQQAGLKMAYISFLISKVSAGGVSDIKRVDSILERWLIIDKSFFVNLRYIFIISINVTKGYINSLFRNYR
jgi:glycosyltransferase involved in cell wall biosynthesis